MLEFPIPPSLFEAMDWFLSIFFGIMWCFVGAHLWMLWNYCRKCFPGTGGTWKCLRGIYYENKLSVATYVLSTALFARFFLLAFTRHVHDHQISPGIITESALLWYVLANAGLVVAVTCYVRNVSPFKIPNWSWLIVIAVATSLSIWMAQ